MYSKVTNASILRSLGHFAYLFTVVVAGNFMGYFCQIQREKQFAGETFVQLMDGEFFGLAGK